jgi:hypothetical protein
MDFCFRFYQAEFFFSASYSSIIIHPWVWFKGAYGHSFVVCSSIMLFRLYAALLLALPSILCFSRLGNRLPVRRACSDRVRSLVVLMSEVVKHIEINQAAVIHGSKLTLD